MSQRQTLAMEFPEQFDDWIFPRERPITPETVNTLTATAWRAQPCPVCRTAAAWSTGIEAFSICCPQCQCFHFHTSAGPVLVTLSTQARLRLSAALAAAETPEIVAADSAWELANGRV